MAEWFSQLSPLSTKSLKKQTKTYAQGKQNFTANCPKGKLEVKFFSSPGILFREFTYWLDAQGTTCN